MKNCLDLLTHQNFIDTAPLLARFEHFTALMLVLIDSGKYKAWARNSGAVCAAVKRFSDAERFNELLRAKLDMLSNNHWRRYVLRQLGGEAALDAWDRRRAKIDANLAAQKGGNPEGPKAPDNTSTWRKTAELIEKDLWHVQHAQKCSKACAPKNVVRDPFKVDFDGLFRLPPLPRPGVVRRSSLEVLATTPNYRENYIYDAIPVTPLSGLKTPICVHPSEFRAAEALAYDAFFKHAPQRAAWEAAIWKIPQEEPPELAPRYGWAREEAKEPASYHCDTDANANPDTDTVCPQPMPETFAAGPECMLMPQQDRASEPRDEPGRHHGVEDSDQTYETPV